MLVDFVPTRSFHKKQEFVWRSNVAEFVREIETLWDLSLTPTTRFYCGDTVLNFWGRGHEIVDSYGSVSNSIRCAKMSHLFESYRGHRSAMWTFYQTDMWIKTRYLKEAHFGRIKLYTFCSLKIEGINVEVYWVHY